MLEAIRSRSKSFVVYGLFILLILSFVVWGAGDVITGQTGYESVATVGDQQIEEHDVRDAFNREINRLRSVFGDRFGHREALAMGFDRSVLSSLVNETLFNLGALDLGLAVSDDVARIEISKDPGFRNTIGDFDLLQFQSVLAANGFTEARYVALIKNDVRRGLYLDALRAGAEPPTALVEALYRYANEQRNVAVVTIKDDVAAETIPEPTTSDLETFHSDNAASFTAPEYRKVSYVSLTASELAGDISVSEAELEQAYTEQESLFNEAERRTIRQIVASDEAKAKEISDAIIGGKPFLEAATELAGMSEAATDLGTVTRDQYLPELADAVFTLLKDGVTEPLRSPLGWHIVQVTDIQGGATKTIDEVRGQLVESVQLTKAVDTMFELSNTFEDALGGGATLEEAAQSIGLNVKTVEAIDARGFDPAGVTVTGLPPEGGFTGIAFQTPENQESTLIEAGPEGYFLLRVDAVTPSRLKPIDEVRTDVIAGWQAAQKASAAENQAKALLETLKSGRELATIAQEQNLDIQVVEGIGRTDTSTLPAGLVDSIFDADLKTSVMGRGDGAALVAQVLAVNIPDPKAAPTETTALKETVASTMEQDILAILATGLQDDFPVRVNEAVLDRIF